MAKRINDDDLVEISGGTGGSSDLEERQDRYNQSPNIGGGTGSGGGVGNTGMDSTGGSTGGAQEWSD
jgi:hypothetical protein